MSLPGSSSSLNEPFLDRADLSSYDDLPQSGSQNGPQFVTEIKVEPLDLDVILTTGNNNDCQANELSATNLFNIGEVKEEVGIKQEEIDDFDNIQPCEPIADIFYPCSGTSRALGQLASSSDEIKEEVYEIGDHLIKEEEEESTSRETSARPKVQRKKRKSKFSYPAKGMSAYYKKKKLMKLMQQQQEEAMEHDVAELNGVYSGSSFSLDGMNEFKEDGEMVDETSLSTRSCYFCGLITSEFYSTSMLNTRQRNAFLISIMAKTAIDRDQLPGVSDVIDRQFFCREHFPAHSVKRNELNVPTLWKGKSGYTKCDLCAVPQPPFRSSPADPIERLAFNHSIVRMNSVQREKFEWIRDNVGIFQAVCSKHFEEEQEEYDDEPSTSSATIGPFEAKLIRKQRKKGTVKRQFYPPKGYHARKLAEKKAREEMQKKRGKSRPLARPAGDSFAVEYVVDKKIAEAPAPTDRKCRKCDLCGGQAVNYVTSPIYSMFAKKFFDNLIWVTAHHKERIAWFLRIGKRATVCARHLRQRATNITKTPPHVVRQLSSTDLLLPPQPLPDGLPELPKEEEMKAPPELAHNYELRDEKPPKRIFSL